MIYRRPDADPNWARRLARAANKKRVLRPAWVRRAYNAWDAVRLRFTMNVLVAGPMKLRELCSFGFQCIGRRHQFGPGYSSTRAMRRAVRTLVKAGLVERDGAYVKPIEKRRSGRDFALCGVESKSKLVNAA